jgi:MSHA pilin protein MshD
MCTNNLERYGKKQAGISLIELIIFIVIIGIGIAGILSVMNVTTSHSADPMLRKQALAIAESLLEEIELQPYTFCDPNDPNAAGASNADATPGNCSSTAQVETVPKTVSNSRYGPSYFNNVSDYYGFSMNPILDISGGGVTGLGAYTATVNITLEGTTFSLPTPEAAMRIDVVVTYGTDNVTLTGYRFRYAPTALGNN